MSSIPYVTAVADCGLHCIEEFFDENLDDYRRLRDHMFKVDCDALTIKGETRSEAAKEAWKYGWYSRRHVETLLALAEEGLIDVINMDLAIVGYTRWRRAMPELAAAGLLASSVTSAKGTNSVLNMSSASTARYVSQFKYSSVPVPLHLSARSRRTRTNTSSSVPSSNQQN